jgi:hypothetical protein
MSNILSYEFEELPLVIHNGIEAALINGMAEIKYDRSGHWDVDSVAVEGHQNLTPEERARGVKPWVYVKATPELEIAIQYRLEQEWFGKVQDAVNEQLAADREDAAEQRADMRRDARMGL